jgi:hypothetical protein
MSVFAPVLETCVMKFLLRRCELLKVFIADIFISNLFGQFVVRAFGGTRVIGAIGTVGTVGAIVSAISSSTNSPVVRTISAIAQPFFATACAAKPLFATTGAAKPLLAAAGAAKPLFAATGNADSWRGWGGWGRGFAGHGGSVAAYAAATISTLALSLFSFPYTCISRLEKSRGIFEVFFRVYVSSILLRIMS